MQCIESDCTVLYLPRHDDEGPAGNNIRGELALGKIVLDDRRRHLHQLGYGV